MININNLSKDRVLNLGYWCGYEIGIHPVTKTERLYLNTNLVPKDGFGDKFLNKMNDRLFQLEKKQSNVFRRVFNHILTLR